MSLVEKEFNALTENKPFPAKSSNNKECMICHYWIFNHGFNFQDYVMIVMI